MMRSESLVRAARALRSRLGEPTLQRRSVKSVLLAFLAIWFVLLGYVYVQGQRVATNAPGLDKFGEALSESLAPIADREQAAAVMAATSHWLNVRRRANGRLPGVLLFELLDAAGRRAWASPALRDVTLQSPVATLSEMTIGGIRHSVFEARSAQWTLRVVEPVRTDADFLAYNARFLLPYLLLALPFILIPVWLSVRNGLRPLQRLAEGIAQRDPDDLAPLALAVRHRELKPLAGSLDSLLARLRHKVERERSFVQDAAHEIRTPLAVITAQAHVLAHADCTQARQLAKVQLNHAIDRASHLAQQLLVLAMLDDAQRLAPRHIDVAQAVRQLLAHAAPAAMTRGIELALEAPDALWLTVDEPALGSIVQNLVDNAVRYGRAGGNVVVELRGDGERLMLQVCDDGPGIPAGDQAQVFERFWRGNDHDASGSGLGLSIVRQAASRMGGKVILIAGLNGRGTGFLVSLPNPDFRAG